MTDTKSCRECVHDIPDDYDEYCDPCITNDKRNWNRTQYHYNSKDSDGESRDPMDIKKKNNDKFKN